MPEGVSHSRRHPRDARQRGGVLDPERISAVILAGGQGTRLLPLTRDRPKPVVPLLNVPFLGYQLALLRRHGVRDIVLSCSHMVDTVKRTMGDGSAHGVRLSYAVEAEPLGTGGGVRNAAPLVDGLIVVLNGDVLTDLDLTAMLAFHRARGAAATIYLTRVPDPAAYGLVETEGDGRVRRFVEKPDPSQITTDAINAGVYLLDRQLLDRIPTGRPVSIEREFFPGLLRDGIAFYGRVAEHYWLDIGNPARYRQGQLDLLARRVATDVAPGGARASAADRGLDAPDGVRVDATAVVTAPAVLGAGSHVARGARVGPRAVLGERCSVGERAIVEGAVLWDDVSVGADARLVDCVIGANVRIGARSAIEAGAVVASGTEVPADTRLTA